MQIAGGPGQLAETNINIKLKRGLTPLPQTLSSAEFSMFMRVPSVGGGYVLLSDHLFPTIL